MIGPKKLGSIRNDLQRAIAQTGEDPIRWLEQRMAAPRRQPSANSEESQILQSLRNVLARSPQRDARTPRAAGTRK
jgi:cytochrome c-type biogenesis protein CcmH/NrfG